MIQPGDLAILVRFPGDAPNQYFLKYFGEQVEVVEKCFYIDQPMWEWKVKAHDEILIVDQRHLKKIPPPNEKSSWEDCVWRPQHIVVSND